MAHAPTSPARRPAALVLYQVAEAEASRAVHRAAAPDPAPPGGRIGTRRARASPAATPYVRRSPPRCSAQQEEAAKERTARPRAVGRVQMRTRAWAWAGPSARATQGRAAGAAGCCASASAAPGRVFRAAVAFDRAGAGGKRRSAVPMRLAGSGRCSRLERCPLRRRRMTGVPSRRDHQS